MSSEKFDPKKWLTCPAEEYSKAMEEEAQKAVRDMESRIIADALGVPAEKVREDLDGLIKLTHIQLDPVVEFTANLHRRLRVQARNLLFEYRLGGRDVPQNKVEELMRTYGNLIAEIIFKDQEKAWSEIIKDLDEVSQKALGYMNSQAFDSFYSGSIREEMKKIEEIRKKYGLKD